MDTSAPENSGNLRKSLVLPENVNKKWGKFLENFHDRIVPEMGIPETGPFFAEV